MTYELRRRLITLIRLLPDIGHADDARAIARHMLLGNVERWLLEEEFGRAVWESIAGGLEAAEHLVPAHSDLGKRVRDALAAQGEANVYLDEAVRAACGRAA